MSVRKRKKKSGEKRKKGSFVKTLPEEHVREIQGLFSLIASIIILLSLISFSIGHDTTNLIGIVGHHIGWTLHGLLGAASYLLPPYLGWIGWRLFFRKSLNHLFLKTIYFLILLLSAAMLLTLFEAMFPKMQNLIQKTLYASTWHRAYHFHLGGQTAYYLYAEMPLYYFSRALGAVGILIIFGTAFVISSLILTKFSISKNLLRIKAFIDAIYKAIASIDFGKVKQPLRLVKITASDGMSQVKDALAFKKEELLEIKPDISLKARPSLSAKHVDLTPPPSKLKPALSPQQVKREAIIEQRVYNGDFQLFKLPAPKLLTAPPKVDQSIMKRGLKLQAEVLEETLHSFGIEAKVGRINCGPTITSFEVHPSIGVKVQKIRALESDIALNMEAKSIRIIAPIPGKAAVGIEVPNSYPQEVSFRDLILAYQGMKKKYHIPVLIGKAVSGDIIMNDLAKMPHCIIAGATGSGKSVFINSIVMSILMNARPDEVKLLMVDPKKVELTQYSKLPHMIAPVITEPHGACSAMMWLVKEMEKRYDILKCVGLRNIEAFNNRKSNREFEMTLDMEIPERIPYIVGIIDELADLMMVASGDIEAPIARIAQMARAVGIHLILATQRPSREVITGLIKANFPTRISFKVASRVNSQIVLDEVGAETLLGNGDMLFLPPGTSHIIRAQGAFIRDEDINCIIEHVSEQAPQNYLIPSFDTLAQTEMMPEKTKGQDKLFDECVKIIKETSNASTTFLQRKLKIGYARAASLMDELEELGIVGPQEGGKGRKILIETKEIEQIQEDFFDEG